MTGHGSASHTSVKPRTSRIAAGTASRDLVGVSANGGTATGRLNAKTVLEKAEGLGAITRTEVGEMGTRRREDLRVERKIWVVAMVMVEIGRHGKEGESDGERGLREEEKREVEFYEIWGWLQYSTSKRK